MVYDGAPTYPGLDAQFALAERTGITYFGTSAGYLSACEKAGAAPPRHLRPVARCGASEPPARRCRPSAYPWVYDAVASDVVLGSLSGGTDVATGFIGASPLLPVTVGELQRPMLGGRVRRPGTRTASRWSASSASW